MKKDTNLYKVLKSIYINKDLISSKEIAETTGIELKQVTPYTNALITYVNKIKKGRTPYYQIKPYRKDYIRKVLQLGEEDED